MGRRYRFGLPGDGINGIMESLRQRQDRIRFVQVRHEETAALMAGGYAKLTGRLGVCLATFEQTKNLVEALARGTPDAGQIVATSQSARFAS